MDRLRSEWANMSAKKRIILGIALAAALVFLVMSQTGTLDLAPVETGVSQIKKG